MNKGNQINFRVDDKGRDALVTAARESGITISQIIRLLISTQLHRLVAKFGRA